MLYRPVTVDGRSTGVRPVIDEGPSRSMSAFSGSVKRVRIGIAGAVVLVMGPATLGIVEAGGAGAFVGGGFPSTVCPWAEGGREKTRAARTMARLNLDGIMRAHDRARRAGVSRLVEGARNYLKQYVKQSTYMIV